MKLRVSILFFLSNILLLFTIVQLGQFFFGYAQPTITVVDTYLARERCDVSEVTYVGFRLVYSSNYSPLAYGRVTFKEVSGQYYTNALGWCILPVYSNEIGKKSWSIDIVEYGGSQLDFQQNMSNPEIIFDKVIISLNSTLSRIGVGVNTSFSYSAVYAYDGRAFLGRVVFNENYIYSDQIGNKEYYIERIEDEEFGITNFQSNSMEVIFDKIELFIQAEDQRVDVGTEANVYLLNGIYLYDGSPFSGDIFLNDSTKKNEVGKYSYTIRSISDDIYGITTFNSNSVEIIYDQVNFVLSVIDNRINIGDETEVTLSGNYSYDGEIYNGEVHLNNDRFTLYSVGRIEYFVNSINDQLHGLTTFTTNSVEVIWDIVSVELSSTSDRIDVGSVAELQWSGVYEFDNSPFSNENKVILDSYSFIKDSVGEYTYDVREIVDEINGISVFKSNPCTIVWDMIDVDIQFPYERIEIGAEAEPIIKAKYRFDDSPFQGDVNVNGSLIQTEIGRYIYEVTSIYDDKYNLKKFSSNKASIIFDDINIRKSIEVNKLGILEVLIYPYYESDKRIVQDIYLIVNGKNDTQLTNDGYKTHFSNWNLKINLDIEVEIPGFSTITFSDEYYCLSNLGLCVLIGFITLNIGIFSYSNIEYSIKIRQKARLEYKNSRGTIHKNLLKRSLSNLHKNTNNLTNNLKRLKEQNVLLLQEKNKELRAKATGLLINREFDAIPGIGPILSKRILAYCYDGTLESLYSAYRVHGIGDTKYYEIRRWITNAQTKLDHLISSNFSGKKEIVDRYKKLEDKIKNDIENDESILDELLRLESKSDEVLKQLERITPSTFVKSYKGDIRASEETTDYLLGIFPEWSRMPKWFKTMLETYG